MSYYHGLLAQVWMSLHGQQDIARMVREIIGQHSIDSTFHELDSIRETSLDSQVIVWIKTIFDLQRSYMSGLSTGPSGCSTSVKACLLPGELLFTLVLYIIRLKRRTHSDQAPSQPQNSTHVNLLLAQTALSGLRLLLLRQDAMNQQQLRTIRKSIDSFWEPDLVEGTEHFIVFDVFPHVLAALAKPPNDRNEPYGAYRHEWQNARIPTFASRFHSLDLRLETFVPPLVHGLMEEDCMDAYWVLYDCLWAVESALTYRLFDIEKQNAASVPQWRGADIDETFGQLYQVRTSLIVSIFHIEGPMTPSQSLMESLATSLITWDADLDSFLTRQDLIQSSIHGLQARKFEYGRYQQELGPVIAKATEAFARWLSNRDLDHDVEKGRIITTIDRGVQAQAKAWIRRITPAQAETLSKNLPGPLLPVYIVDCPKLHVVPKKYLAYQLRWCDKWAYESIQADSPIVEWKEGVQCPSCVSREKIRLARLIEPLKDSEPLDEPYQENDPILSPVTTVQSASYDAEASQSCSEAHNNSSGNDSGILSQSTLASSPLQFTNPEEKPPFSAPELSRLPPDYSESPISPAVVSPLSNLPRNPCSFGIEDPVSPLVKSLNIPILRTERYSLNLPEPVDHSSSYETPSHGHPEASTISQSETSSSSPNALLPAPSSTATTAPKSKSSRTLRIANSMRRKSSTKAQDLQPLPKEPTFSFSSQGKTLLLWERGGNHVTRFDLPDHGSSTIQGCRYDVANIEMAAAGNRKCAIISANETREQRLSVFNGDQLFPQHELTLESSDYANNISLAVSKDDRFAALSTNDYIQVFNIKDGIQKLPFHNQIHVYELRSGIASSRTLFVGRTTGSTSTPDASKSDSSKQGKGLTQSEHAEEQRRSTTIITRKLYFSTDSKQLVVATQQGDNHVYIDVYDCTREPISTIAETSRSFKLPPWTLNDGDLTSIFYDSARRNAIVTAFLGKEYPILVPFPGYDSLQNETYSTKVVHAAQSPSGSSFIVANSMTEIIRFENTAKDTLAPRKMKKCSGKISSSVFKPGMLALSMPDENVLQCFWIKDGKCVLRTVKIGSTETFTDTDIRPYYERLMSLSRPLIARAPSLMIPEMDAT